MPMLSFVLLTVNHAHCRFLVIILSLSVESRGALVSAITNAHTNAIFASSRLNYNQGQML
jgi:hypothetical protein